MSKVHTNAGIEANKITEEEYDQIEKENLELIEHYGWADCCRFCGYSNGDDPTINFGKFGNKLLYPCSKHNCLVNPDKMCPDFKE